MRFIFLRQLCASVIVIFAAILPLPAALAADKPPLAGDMEIFTVLEKPVTAPDIHFQDINEKTVTLKQFRGKLVLLNFWASWCPPCVAEMPSLDRLQGQFDKKTFEIVSISLDTGGLERARPFFERYGLRHLTLYIDPENDSAQAFRLSGIPVSLLIDEKGRVLGRYNGSADWNGYAAQNLIRYYLGKKQ